MYIILLKKLRFSCTGKGGIHWQYGVPKWFEILLKVGNPCSKPSLDSFLHKYMYAKVIDLCNMVLWSIGFIANQYCIPLHQICLCACVRLRSYV